MVELGSKTRFISFHIPPLPITLPKQLCGLICFKNIFQGIQFQKNLNINAFLTNYEILLKNVLYGKASGRLQKSLPALINNILLIK